MADATDSMRHPHSLGEMVGVLSGIGPGRAGLLKGMGILTIGDLLGTYPIRYMDLSRRSKISELRVGQTVSVSGTVRELSAPPSRRGRPQVVTAAVYDRTGVIHGVWFNQKHIASAVSVGDEIAISGKVTFKFGRLQIEGPIWELLSNESSDSLHTNGIVPVHPCTKGLTPRQLRVWVRRALDAVSDSELDSQDPVPPDISSRRELVSRAVAVRNVHFPDDLESLKKARGRIKYEEILVLQTAVAIRKARVQSGSGYSHDYSGDATERLSDLSGITPTLDQAAAARQIIDDMRNPRPMRQLLQGDVGSGKTFVATAALLHALFSGGQAAVMAPTESLALQLSSRLGRVLDATGFSSVLLTGGTPASERKRILGGLLDGSIQSVIGTHSLIQEDVKFSRLTFAVIDEQHRFGVSQRDALASKSTGIDLLVMTATPIPRTLALTVYGELELTTLNSSPNGRALTETKLVSNAEMSGVYSEVRRRVSRGEQGYVVFPLIESADSMSAPSLDVEYDRIRDEYLAGIPVGMLHGRMKSDEKATVLKAFQNGDIKVLVSTTVIEVGIDVSSATVMVIRGPERYGLSQLHQLRGRIGRGDRPSVCFVVDDGETPDAAERLATFANISDGFELAELDLETRGQGEILGVRQSGFGALGLVRLPRDSAILEQARHDAFRAVQSDPDLKHKKFSILRRYAHRVFAQDSGIEVR